MLWTWLRRHQQMGEAASAAAADGKVDPATAQPSALSAAASATNDANAKGYVSLLAHADDYEGGQVRLSSVRPSISSLLQCLVKYRGASVT
jgi:hypothetical protein